MIDKYLNAILDAFNEKHYESTRDDLVRNLLHQMKKDIIDEVAISTSISVSDMIYKAGETIHD
jgi:hypothetical protein